MRGDTVNKFKKNLLSTVFIGSMIGMASVSALADDGDYDAQGVKAGSFLVFPTLTVDEIFNDNLYNEKTSKTDDMITVISPDLSIKSDWNNHSLKFDFGAEVGRYADQGADDYEQYDSRVRARIDATKAVTISADGRYQALTEDRGGNDVGSDASAPIETNQTSFELEAAVKPNRIGVTVTGNYDDYDYDDNVNTDATTTNNDDRDREDIVATVRVGYDIQENYEAFVALSANDIDYNAATDDNGENRDSDGYSVYAGVAIDLTGLVTADISAGYFSQDYTDAALKDADGFAGDVDINWDVTPLTTIRGTVGGGVNETTTSGVSSTIGTNIGVGIDHDFLENLTASADLKWSNSDYEGATDNREDDKIVASIGADYKINRNFFTGAEYKYTDRDSNINTNDYDANVFTLTVGAQF